MVKVPVTNPDLMHETLIPVSRAGRYFPVPISRPTVERLMRHGKDGVVLESLVISNRRYISIEAIERFIQRTNEQRDTAGHVRRSPAELAVKKLELGLN